MEFPPGISYVQGENKKIAIFNK